MNEVVRKYWAEAWSNGDFFLIETSSGYRSTQTDPKGKKHFLTPNASDEELGVALLDSLSHSRFVLPAPRKDVWIHPEAEFDSDLYDYNLSIERAKKWVANLMAQYGYKTKRSLYKNMQTCSIEISQEVMAIQPWHHEKLEAWGGIVLENVIIPADSTPAEIGVALRLAFSRCTSSV